jgi:hypothetical protein
MIPTLLTHRKHNAFYHNRRGPLLPFYVSFMNNKSLLSKIISASDAQHKKGDAGVPDGTVNCTVYTMSQTSWTTLKSED